jgi:YVTN family beta-propeller protein
VTAYVANGDGNKVTPINTATSKAGTPIVVGSGPSQIAITPNGKTAYVIAGGSVVPISTATSTALKPIKGTAAPATSRSPRTGKPPTSPTAPSR